MKKEYIKPTTQELHTDSEVIIATSDPVIQFTDYTGPYDEQWVTDPSGFD